ncbi:uncharacterized protein ColSpa_11937 [Colletotrichum spaethianum]|uniref:Uncharacterized protein n=1 Tax=Colletotrichum spaethianum TaxID=700344 RepID=A0AA37PG95_9PEZI|nr:uncharacterized protein ColSpa_11937 [Colletotrichum spaethianum]GKT51756.1 hypothetical protein ColSpa_11937 [Colletotrichum spaethianum]
MLTTTTITARPCSSDCIVLRLASIPARSPRETFCKTPAASALSPESFVTLSAASNPTPKSIIKSFLRVQLRQWHRPLQDARVTQAVSDALSVPDNLEVVNLPNFPLHHPHDGGRTLPDAAWTILDQEAHPTNQHPVVAAEVAVSSPRTLHELAQRACDIIEDSNDGILSAVVASKL